MAESTEGRRERELVLAPNEFAYISDETKGNVDIYVGPNKTSLAATDQPVLFNHKTKKFERLELRQAIQTTAVAPEGWYLVLKNPSRSKDDAHPKAGARASMPVLDVGRKVNIPGPCSFALWPGQMGKVLQGHHIRSNQYLLVRVYDEDAARENWKNSIIKTKKDGEEGAEKLLSAMPDLTMGKLIVIKGTDVSFYIPPTGIEVVPDEHGTLVRDAVTLERLEYCLLLDENGNKRYVQGPSVVFPKPTEVFVQRTSEPKPEEEPKPTRKFKAIELSETSGIYVKVIAEYEENGQKFKVGDELFITGRETMIYFPREEHAIIKYGDQTVNYATAIPAGEARYVLNRQSGDIRLVKGPMMFLADPRHEVIAKRLLDLKLCQLLYPGNAEALQHNADLAGVPLAGSSTPSTPTMRGIESAVRGSPAGAIGSVMYAAALDAAISNSAEARGLGGAAAKGFTGDNFQRKGQFTEPRSVTLNTKYQGAVTTSIWTGYAMLLVRKSGERRVVQGPTTVMLEYDEEPQVLSLSTGKPKNTDNLYKTVFLRTHANMVGDIIEVETKDFCKVSVKAVYRVNFEGDPKKWFDVENYVKFLCDHMRSRLRNAVRKFTIEEFYLNSEALLRDVVLGKPVEPSTGKLSMRPGAVFEENGMRIYDVEILQVNLQNQDIEKLLIGSQREAINHALSLASARRLLDFTKQNEVLKQEKLQAEAETGAKTMAFKQDDLKLRLALDLDTLAAAAKTQAEKARADEAAAQAETVQAQYKLAMAKAADEQALAMNERALEQRLKELNAEVQAVVEKAKAVSPDLVAALNAFGERAMVEKVAEAMAPLGILGGGKKSVTEILGDLLKGTTLAKQLLSTNGSTPKTDVQIRT